VSSLIVAVRDVGPVIAPGLTVWMYLTPVLYPESLVPPSMGFLVRINPMSYYVRAERALIMDGRLPSAAAWAAMIVFATGFALGGYQVFQRLKRGFTDAL
jgi:ABC-type polysaccharide/polyol phosphate export permease